MDLSFTIAKIEAYHLVFPQHYWEDYRSSSAGPLNAGQSTRVEFKPGWRTVYAKNVETPVVKVTFRNGWSGWGEANCPIGPEVVQVLCNGVIADMVVGKTFGSPLELWTLLYSAQQGRGYLSGYWLDALAAVDIAIWDALGKRLGMPVAALIYESPLPSFPVYLSGLRQASLVERAKALQEWCDTGLQGVKIFPHGSVSEALIELDALMQAAPQITAWMVDMLWMLEATDAATMKRELGNRNALFLECPLPPEDLAAHQQLVAQPGAAIALGEHFRTHNQLAPWFSRPRALDIFQSDIGRTGITDFMHQLQMAQQMGLSVTPHMGNGTAIFQAATLQCAAGLDYTGEHPLLQEFQAGLKDIAKEAVKSEWYYKDGIVKVPDAPGLGVSVKQDYLLRFAV